MKVKSCELRGGRWEVRIQLPSHDIERPSNDISVGSWQSPDAHGLLISATDVRDLQALAYWLGVAANKARRTG